MYFPRVEDNQNNRSMIDTWYGYDHRYRIDSGYLYDMENLTTDNFPLLTPRKKRPVLIDTEYANIQGMIYSDGEVYYLIEGVLHYGSKEIDLSEYNWGDENQTIIRMGAYLVFFPSGVYVNLFKEKDRGTIDVECVSNADIEVTYSICDSEGRGYDNIVVSDEAPEEPKNNMYWLCTAEGSKGLNVWYSSKNYWSPVATSYIRIEIPGIDISRLSVGDCVTMNTHLPDINSNSQIRAKGDDWIVVIGFMDEVVHKTVTTNRHRLILHRIMPELDYVCMDKNRIWGCHYGFKDGEMVNEIYASKLGDFRNWYCYQGLSTDSYAASVGVPGEWTGCISYQGYPTFFKENAIIKVYGSYPSEYQTLQSDCRGVQKGSDKSLAIVDEVLIYKSTTDICAYDGSTPVGISDNFGRDALYYDAVAGSCLHKYRVVMQNAYGTYYQFVYDVNLGLWVKEDALPIIAFSSAENGQMYGYTENKIYGFGSTDNYLYTQQLPTEEWVNWYAETGRMGYEYPDYKYVSKLTIRVFLEAHSEIQVYIRYDDFDYEEVGTLRGDGNGSQSIDIFPYRCDTYQIKMVGHGETRIYSMAITLEVGSEDDHR